MVSEKNRKNWEWVATYNPLDDIQKIKIPVLLMFGNNDMDQPTNLSIMEWKKGFGMAGNNKYRIEIFNAGHGIRIGGHGHSKGWPRFAEGYLETQITWLNNL
jgi:hypothetical protein